MKKIGIVTFHDAKNYGAVLQGYALQKTIQNIGRECEIVNYRCKSIINGYKPFQFRKNDPVKSVLKSVLLFRKRAKRIRQFESFYNGYLNVSQKTYDSDTVKSCKNDYYKFISGSDQVWGAGAKGVNPDSAYFLGFADDRQKYSYAASFGTADIPDEKVPVIRELLKGFQSFSVREDSAVDIVRKTTGQTAQVNIDPTFLLPSEQWRSIAKVKEKTPYILVFNVKPVKSMVEFAAKLSKEKNIPVIYITDIPHKKREGFTFLPAPTVEEFIGYFLNAEYVVTNSFHGTAFSVIFHKNLFVEYDTAQGRNNRAENLLDKLGIKREIKNGEAKETEIDWENVDKIISEERQKSIEYLTKITE